MIDETEKLSLEDLGYNSFFELKRKELGLIDYLVARVTVEYKGTYRVISLEGEYLARVTGKQMFTALEREDYPAVGDWVAISDLNEGKAVIQAILPRKTVLKKKYSYKQEVQVIASNIDVAFIVESLDRDYNLNRFERYLVLIKEAGIKPVIILNKIDLISETELKEKVMQVENRFPSVDIIQTSVINEKGLDDLRNYIEKNKTYCFLGSSGVGKSSLINRLIGKDQIKTGEIGSSTGRGKHTTTNREMHFLDSGGIVIDNPGTREVGIADAKKGIESLFNKISSLTRDCKYSDCTHTHEPGCAILKAIERKEIDGDKYQNYLKLKKEAEYYEMTNLEKRKKDREFGQYVKKVKDQLEGFKGRR